MSGRALAVEALEAARPAYTHHHHCAWFSYRTGAEKPCDCSYPGITAKVDAALTALRAEDAAEREAVEGLIEVAESYEGDSFDAFCAIAAARTICPARNTPEVPDSSNDAIEARRHREPK